MSHEIPDAGFVLFFLLFFIQKEVVCTASFLFREGPEKEVYMEQKTYVQSSFSRSLAADAKASFYPTDIEHCRMIHAMLEFPNDLNALEPSIGDGTALKAVMGINGTAPKGWRLFGVEVDDERAKMCQEDPAFECVVKADFLDGTKISHNAFGFCFANPPYGVWQTETRSVRYERAFMEKIWNHLKTGAVFVYVIPYSVFSDEGFLKLWVSRFNTCKVFKFHEKEFEKYKQIVAIGTKKAGLGFLKEDLDVLAESVKTLDVVPLLPLKYEGEKIAVPVSAKSLVQQFAAREFNIDAAEMRLSTSPLYQKTLKGLKQESYAAYDLARPPLPLKSDLAYLASVCGCGQGLAGSEEEGTLHLQRGSVTARETSTVDVVANIEVVRETAAITMKVIENDGTITTF